MIRPGDCTSMAELRQQIDLLDREIVAMLLRRAGYIDRAIALKQVEQMPARISERVEDVVDNVRASAQELEFDPDLVEQVWRQMIEWSIAREERVLGPSPQE